MFTLAETYDTSTGRWQTSPHIPNDGAGKQPAECSTVTWLSLPEPEARHGLAGDVVRTIEPHPREKDWTGSSNHDLGSRNFPRADRQLARQTGSLSHWGGAGQATAKDGKRQVSEAEKCEDDLSAARKGVLQVKYQQEPLKAAGWEEP